MSEDGYDSALTIAAVWKNSELLEILLSHPEIKINKKINSDGPGRFGEKCQWTALLFACEDWNSAIVSRLVQVPGLDINYQDEEEGWTAPLVACIYGDADCVRILAETGRVDWNKANEWGKTPLFWALRGGVSDIVDIIVKQPNVDYNVKTKDGDW